MEKYGIIENAAIAVRFEPSEKSEMVTQVLFGETVKIINETETWYQIETIFDNYPGWIDKKTITLIDHDYLKSIESNYIEVAKNPVCVIRNTNSDESILIPMSSSLPFYNKKDGSFTINETNYFLNNPTSNQVFSISEHALTLLNAPYLWGGKNPFGIDCSGFVQVVFKTVGLKLPRDASQQVNIGKTIEFFDQIKPGDLAFFDNEEGKIIHVGIIISKNEIIHASGKVRIDTIDHQGIFNKEIKDYTHKLRIIKRIN
ncbi:MAG: NlpC/P60 family protein [Bacteroidales bacterium]